MELEADILHTRRRHQYYVLVKYEPLTPSIGDSGAEKLLDFTTIILLDITTLK